MTPKFLVRTAAVVALAAALASCGSDDSGDADASAGTEEPVVIDVTIADGHVHPSGETVEADVGQEIEVRVDSDAADVLHVHSSPEHEYTIKPTEDQVFRFAIDNPGQVEIEAHETETLVAEVVVS